LSSSVFARMIVPLDGSQLAEAALDEAASLAADGGGEIILATVADTSVLSSFEDFAEAEHMSATRALDRYLAGLVAKLTEKGIEARFVVSDDSSAARGLLDLAAKHEATAIVLSTHGRSGIGRWLLGSVAEKVVRGAVRHVLIVK